MKVIMGQPNDLLVDDLELLLREIDEFNTATSNNKPVDIPQTLENYLQFVAKSGNTVFPWPHVKVLYRTKIANAIQQFQEPICPSEAFILERFDMFRTAAPFTIQRLTELILQPTRHYRKKEKFLRGLEKTVTVVSTIEPRSLTGEEEKNGAGDETINTSTSSCEAEADSVSFNRTYPVDQQQQLNTISVHSTPIDVISQNLAITTDIVMDSVTTSETGVDVINQSISVTSNTMISVDNVTTTEASTINIITPDILTTVTSESIILNPVSETSTSLINIDSNDALNTPMECESSTATVSPAVLECVTEPDLVSTAMHHANNETLAQPHSDNVNVLEDVSSSLVMDAVKLPLEDGNKASVDCHSSVAATEVTDDADLFHCVNVTSNPDPTGITALTTSHIPEASASAQTVISEEEASNVNESEPTLADVSTTLAPSDNSTSVGESIESVDDTPSAMDCENSEKLPESIEHQSVGDATSLDSTTTPAPTDELAAEVQGKVEGTEAANDDVPDTSELATDASVTNSDVMKTNNQEDEGINEGSEETNANAGSESSVVSDPTTENKEKEPTKTEESKPEEDGQQNF